MPVASRSTDSDTLTRAEEEALARAKATLEREMGRSKSGAKKPASRKPAGKGGGKGSGKGRSRKPAVPARLVSVDLLRGFAVVASAILLADLAPATVPPWARPSVWHGYTPADLVLPLFLLVAGISLAYAEVRHDTMPVWRRGLRVVRRVVVLVGLGVGLNWLADPDLGSLRWTGLLQRVGLATLLAWGVSRSSRRVQIGAMVGVLGGWWFLLERVAVPGSGRVAVSPEQNLARWVDLELLGAAHTVAPTDPLGIATTIPAAVIVLAGVLTGRWLRDRPTGPATAAALAVAGGWLSILAIGAAQVTPLNATLWTSPYLLFATGVGLAALAVVYLLTEVLPVGRAAWPLVALGSQPLVAYAVIAAPIAFLSRAGASGETAWGRAVDGFFGPLFGDWSGVVIGLGLAAVALWVVRRLDRLGVSIRA